MNTRRILALALGARLFLGITSSFGQTNNETSAVLKQDSGVSNLGDPRHQQAIAKGAAADCDYLIQIRNQSARNLASAGAATNDAPAEIANLEWTGQYIERFLRIPEGNSGKPKLVRFLIPVYREKSTKPEASVGTEDKQEQDRRVPEIGSAK